MLHILQEIAIVSHPTLLHCLTMLHYYSSYIVTFLVLLHHYIVLDVLHCSCLCFKWDLLKEEENTHKRIIRQI